MNYLYYVLAGALGGVLAGMGMGGGTLTMPILVLALGVAQLTAQFANLIAFLPSGSAALLLHAKNGYLNADVLPPLIVPALLACLITSYFAPSLDAALLKKLFGGFLVAVALISLTAKALKKS